MAFGDNFSLLFSSIKLEGLGGRMLTVRRENVAN